MAMGKYDFSRLYEQYPAVISQMEQHFTSHEFILELARQNQVAYIEALYAYRRNLREGKPAPFMIVHGILARHLRGYPRLIMEASPGVPSHDIFRQDNTASLWRKVG
jgi:hypothetical protein